MQDNNFTIRSYQTQDQGAVIELWRECSLVVPQNDPERDIERKINVNREMFLVGLLGEVIVATVMAGYEGHRGWINYLAVSPSVQRRSLGRQMMDKAEALLRDAGCPKINLQVRASNSDVIEFYQSIGFSVDNVISMGKRLVEDASEQMDRQSV